MLVTITTQQTLDIALPYYSKEGSKHYRINENESITSVYVNEKYCSINTETSESWTIKYEHGKVAGAEPSTHCEFMAALEAARAFHEREMKAVTT